MKKFLVAAGIAALSGAAWAQDSVALTPCLPGDAVSPYDATEQCDSFVVDMDSFSTSWGTTFGIAPVLKSTKVSTGFINNLISAQAMSSRQLTNVPFASSSYALWTNAPGVGVNNNPAINAAPNTISTANRTGVQFGIAFADFGTTNNSPTRSYNGVVGGLVNIDAADTSRLYVKRVTAAINGCDPASDVSQFGIGGVDDNGNIGIRADAFGSAGPSANCAVATLVNNNYFIVDASARACGSTNVINNAGGTDAAATTWLVRNQATQHNTPNILPRSMRGGGSAAIIGSNFNKQYVRGATFPVTQDLSELNGRFDIRGGVAYCARNFSCLNSTAGTAGLITKAAADPAPADGLNVWGLDAAGTITGIRTLLLPSPVTDARTGALSASTGGLIQTFDHYRSQVATRGGNSPMAIGGDRNGNLMAAGVVYHGLTATGDATWPVQYIAVARYNCTTNTTQWSMAGYSNALDSGGAVTGGKPILDGPGGTPIGRMTTLGNVTGGTPVGPSVSAPMIDSVGNVWFMSAVELNDGLGGTFFTNAVLRAVLVDEANLGYDLELVFRNGSTFDGINSGRQYRVSFLSIADSNSVDSASAFSSNISSVPHMSGSVTGMPNSDPRTLGGMVINAQITYDYDADGTFNNCTATTNPGPADPRYSVLLYVGALTSAPPPCPGDINNDGQRNLTDLSILLAAFGTSVGNPGYNAAADLNNDGSIGLTDLAILLAVFGSPCP